jgi:hypothetical protein
MMMMTMLDLAQVQVPPIDGVGQWVWHGIGVLAIGVLVLTAIEKAKKIFGRTPPLGDVLAGMATLKHVEEAKAGTDELKREFHLRSRGLEEQISGLRHELRGEYQASKSSLELSHAELTDHLALVRSELHQQLKAAEIKLAAVDADNKSQGRKMESMDTKLDRLLERAHR